jgi:DNA replication protein DnaC
MYYKEEEYKKEVKRWENRLTRKCDICNGEGMVLAESGSGLHQSCICRKKAMLYAELVLRGIPRKYLMKWDWKDCDDKEFINKCKNYVKDFEDNYFMGRGLYLYGGQGRGKTTMESLIARDVAKKKNPDTEERYIVAFAIFEDLVQLSHQGRNNSTAHWKLKQYIEGTDLLIIDNIGSETGVGNESKYTAKLLEYILRKRDNNCVPTIISSNMTVDELLDYYTSAVRDFILGSFEQISVTGKNHRKDDKTKNNNDDLDSLLKDFQ